MIPFRRILFATDFSPACQAAVPYVEEAAERFNAELTVLHVSDTVPVLYGEYATFAAESMQLYAEARNRACVQLTEFASKHFTHTKPAILLEEGEAGAMIEKVAARDQFDLIMMPTHGHGTLRRLLLGSVTSKVLHDTSCAVWTGVHLLDSERTPKRPYESILCAVDFDDEAQIVIRAAAFLARGYGASLTLAHIAELPPANYAVDLTPYRKAILQFSEAELRRLMQETKVEADIQILAGPAAAGLREIAVERKADLLVVGRGSSQSRVQRMWSNLYSIIRESPCPVLSV